jgi:hypothetical protein
MSRNAGSPPDASVWQAQNLRLIVFPVDAQLPLQRDWWRELTGNEPDTALRKRMEREEGGLYEGVQLIVSLDPLRIQWTAAAPIDPQNLPEQTPLLGAFLEKREWFRNLMDRWLTMCPPVKRVAFLGTLFQRVSSHDEGYARLDQYLPHVEVHPDSSDFMYRVNRRRPSRLGIPDLAINRLCTWSVAKITTDLAALIPPGVRRAVERSEEYYCALELDVNTIHEYPGSQLPQDRLVAILHELIDLATEVATRGDVRE